MRSQASPIELARITIKTPAILVGGQRRGLRKWGWRCPHKMGMEMPSQVQEMIQAAREGELPQPVKDLQPGLTEV